MALQLTTGYSFSEGETNVTHTKLNNAINNATCVAGSIAAADLADDCVTRDEIHSNVAGSGLAQNANGSLEIAGIGYTTTTLAGAATTTLTRASSTRVQRFTGTLSGANVVNIVRTNAVAGDQFFVFVVGVVTTASNTLTFQENGSGSLKVYNTSATVTRFLHFVYTGSAWILIQETADAPVSLTADVTGTLPLANGGTGQTSKTAAYDALSPTTTQGDIEYHNGTNVVRLAKGTALQQLRMNSGATAPEWATISAGTDIVVVNETQASGTNGGSSTTTTWQTRTINTEVADTGNNCTIASNQITLLAGTYRCMIRAPLYNGSACASRLRNITDGSTTLMGSGLQCFSAGGVQVDTWIVGRFTIAGTKTFEVQTYVGAGIATTGLGYPGGTGESEIFTVAVFWKE